MGACGMEQMALALVSAEDVCRLVQVRKALSKTPPTHTHTHPHTHTPMYMESRLYRQALLSVPAVVGVREYLGNKN